MGSLSGILPRPLMTVAAIALASISTSTDMLTTLRPIKTDISTAPTRPRPLLTGTNQRAKVTWSPNLFISELPRLSPMREDIPLPPNLHYFWCNACFSPNTLSSLLKSYQSANLLVMSNPHGGIDPSPSSSPDALYKWHLPCADVDLETEGSDRVLQASRTIVVLLGWLGSKQKHLQKYADWYTSRGFHVISFTFPISDALGGQFGGKSVHELDMLVTHLADWLEDGHRRNLVFHTFSNTGWLVYGAMLAKFQEDGLLIRRIKGCVVDSAPVAVPNPQVWAKGFSAALLKKNSIANKMHAETHDPCVTEAVLLAVLEKFFMAFLNLPPVKRKLGDLLHILCSQQPKCPQLYMYSSADRVIPSEFVESYIEQMKGGWDIRAHNFLNTPHVDHFRNDPETYTAELSNFLDRALSHSKHC